MLEIPYHLKRLCEHFYSVYRPWDPRINLLPNGLFTAVLDLSPQFQIGHYVQEGYWTSSNLSLNGGEIIAVSQGVVTQYSMGEVDVYAHYVVQMIVDTYRGWLSEPKPPSWNRAAAQNYAWRKPSRNAARRALTRLTA